MRQINFKYILGVVGLTLAVGGCLSIPNSPTPRFYALSAVDENQVGKKIDLPSDAMIGIGPVKIPEYQNRPQMVTLNKEKMLQFAQFDRWGESLDLGVARLVRENLTAMLPKAKLTLYPWNPSIAVKYQVTIEVIQLESELDRDMFFVVQWTIIDVQNSKAVMIKRSEFRQPIIPQNYSGLAQTLSKACASLSSQIADALGKLYS
jgi:uncharacterized lipoprotein YmbA